MPKKILVLCGPTATGKTKLGVALAQRHNGEIVSADSMQVYRGMAIGTAQPTFEEMQGIPHHMMGIVDPGKAFSVARYVEEATACVEDILSRGKLPIVVGGTGLYIDALCKGLPFSAFRPSSGTRTRLQERAKTEGLSLLWQELKTIDPPAAERIHPNDEKRILRALEVFLETGKTITQHNEETKAIPPRYDALTLTLTYKNRDELRERIDRRVDLMLEAGLLDEIHTLLDLGLSPDCTALQAIGYKELIPAILKGTDLAPCIEEVKLRSRQYAKRQLTWFRRNPGAIWIELENYTNFSDTLQNSTEILMAHGLG